MRLTTGILSAFTRRTRWSEGHIFAITPEQIGILEGIRASFAIAVMLGADLLLQIPDFAYGAVAAFWTCLCDPGGSDRSRLRVMGRFAIGATFAISTASYAAHWGRIEGGAALFLLVLLCGLTRSFRPTFGPMPAPIGLIAAIAAVVGVTSPRSAEDALHLALCFLLGAIAAVVLCVYIWRIHPRAPARRALVAIFARLDDMMESLQQLDLQGEDSAEAWAEFNVGHRRAVRFSIERGREIVARLGAGRARFGQGIDAAGRVFAAVMALGHYRAGLQHPFDRSTERALVDRLRRLIQQAEQQSETLAPASEPLMTDGAALLGDAKSCQSVAAHAVAFAADALVGLAGHWREPDAVEGGSEPAADDLSLTVLPPVRRYALRVATAVLISYALGAWIDLSFSYWGTIATLVLMQPLGANTWLRIIERAVGSVIGGVLTAILIARLSGPVEMVLFIAPLSAAVIALRLVNYALFVIFVTPMFVLVSDFIHPASNLISSRIINEIIGACIGLGGSLLLWPEKEDGALSDAILAAVAANMAFASAVLRADSDALGNLDPLRRDAGVTSVRAEIARQRMLLQGRSHSAHLDRVHDILTALRTLCGAANIFAIMRQFEPEGRDEPRAQRYDTLAKQMRETFMGSGTSAAIVQGHEPDDLGHAIQSLALAVQDYAAEAHPKR